MNDLRLARALAYAGYLPFAACAALALVERRAIGVDTLFALQAYSLAIAAFMAGTIWGYALPGPSTPGEPTLLLASNAVALAVFFAQLAPSSRATLGVDILAFSALLAVDAWAARRGRILRDYLRLRLGVTALVLLTLGVVWIAL